MYTQLVNIITSYTRMRDLADAFDFDFDDKLEIGHQLEFIEQGIDRLTAVLQQECSYTSKMECLMLQFELVHLGTMIEENVQID